MLKNDTNIIAQAQTGTGKTAAFGIGILSRLDVKANHIQALVLCPTRELADQVAKEIRKLARMTPNIAAAKDALSHLDLIVIYDAAGVDQSDGRRPLAARTYYARLTQALVTALENERIAGAALDVIEGEPDVPAACRTLPNLICTPHVGGLSAVAFDEMVTQGLASLAAHFAGDDSLPGQVTP